MGISNKEAIEHAKALQDFCMEADCKKCPFSIESELVEDRMFCKLSDYEDPPCGWDLEASE